MMRAGMRNIYFFIFALKYSPVLPQCLYVAKLAQQVEKLAQENFEKLPKNMLFLFI
jgi:hypothetical protein